MPSTGDDRPACRGVIAGLGRARVVGRGVCSPGMWGRLPGGWWPSGGEAGAGAVVVDRVAAGAGHLIEGVPHVLECAEFLLDGDEFLLGEAGEVFAADGAVGPQREEALDVGESEAELLEGLYLADSFDGGVRVATVARGGTGRFGEQTSTLVVTQSFDVDPSPAGDLSGSQVRSALPRGRSGWVVRASGSSALTPYHATEFTVGVVGRGTVRLAGRERRRLVVVERARWPEWLAAPTDLVVGAVVGVGVSLSLAALMLAAHVTKLTPLPAPLAMAFARVVLPKGSVGPGEGGLLWVGLALHVAYVTGATVGYVAFVRRRMGLVSAVSVALGLWVVAGLVFAPVAGWGAFASGIGLGGAVTLLAIHLLFAVFLWAGTWVAFRDSPPTGVPTRRAVAQKGEAVMAR